MAWSLIGTYFESCNCDLAGPCIFLSPPNGDDCTVLVGWHIEDGSDEGVSFSGLNMALAVHSPGHMTTTKRSAAVMSSMMMRFLPGPIAGGVLVGVGLSQFTPPKPACLRSARARWHF